MKNKTTFERIIHFLDSGTKKHYDTREPEDRKELARELETFFEVLTSNYGRDLAKAYRDGFQHANDIINNEDVEFRALKYVCSFNNKIDSNE